ncbi:AMP-dependent synthetase/ligase [Hamadaea tsunoensis]|uniref:AMP-dependent synthetase/ligase n=1 Tax=Hamadaea tsunoensis TaxID=53368 RepID=UPI0004060D9F|nr:AMP-dependent synthetase/ligase [Hamadaea tsunoensis]
MAATLCSAFQEIAVRDPDAVALQSFDTGLTVTWADYARRVRLIAGGLAALGVRGGDTVALMLSNRPEFHLCDTAAVHLGAVPFSLYNSSSPEQIAHILRDAGAAVVITERQYAQRVAAAGVPGIKLVCVDGEVPDASTLDELEALDPGDFDFDAAWRAVGPADLLTIIYTSGTTGRPKGVELTHANLLAEVAAVDALAGLRADDETLSYLPAAHIADRLASHYVQLLYGTRITCLADLKRLGEALVAVRPTYLGTVPRVLEKMRAGVEEALLGAPALRRKVFRAAARSRGPVRALADRVVLASVRARLGLDRTRWIMSGAAPLPVPVLTYFLDLGVRVSEVYGLSETCGVSTLNPPDAIRPGTVGRALDGVQLRLEDDGELLIRGPIVTRGYRGDAAATAAAFDGDWLRTGDVATLDDDGYVRIVGRKKELIINAAGKNMAPTAIEAAVATRCPYIGAITVIGDRRPYNVALIVLDAEAVAAGLARDPSLDPAAEVARAVEEGNATLARIEQIKRYAILPGTWAPGGEELTPTLKLRRMAIAAKYAAEIEALYTA